MRVLLCGSRRWTDVEQIRAVLGNLPKDTVIVHGGAAGAEAIADREAQALGLQVEVFLLDTERFGRRAAMLRDREMLAGGIERVIAFRMSGISVDTDRVLLLAVRAGVDVPVHHGFRPMKTSPLERLQGDRPRGSARPATVSPCGARRDERGRGDEDDVQ